jgi:hypothetical protein
LAGIEPTPVRPKGAGYARLNLSATAGMIKVSIGFLKHHGLTLRSCRFQLHKSLLYSLFLKAAYPCVTLYGQGVGLEIV